jgi:exosortase/archaeosortase
LMADHVCSQLTAQWTAALTKLELTLAILEILPELLQIIDKYTV